MSYCRSANPNSEVYMYGDVNGKICCCGCPLLAGTYPHRRDGLKYTQINSCWFETRSEAILHLRHHRLYGHKVPRYAEKTLMRELREEGETLEKGKPYLQYKKDCIKGSLNMYKRFGYKPTKGESDAKFLKRMYDRDMRKIKRMFNN